MTATPQCRGWPSGPAIQSGHWARHNPSYDLIAADYARLPVKPCLDGEPCCEQIAVQFKPELGRFDDLDIRAAAYRAVFAGAHGHTYGANGIFQFHVPSGPDEFDPIAPWQAALSFPGAGQLRHPRALVESRPFLSRIPDQSLIVGDAGEGVRHVPATRDERGSYAMLYVPEAGRQVTVDTGKLSGERLTASWYDPRTGKATVIKGDFPVGERSEFTTPAEGPAWVLVLGDAARGFGPPGHRG